MGRTWLLRGCAIAVFAVLGSAWATGVVGLGDSAAPAIKHTVPDSSDAPDHARAVHFQRGSVLERAKPRRTHRAEPSEAAYTEPTPSGSDEPTDAEPGTPSPSSTSGPGQSHPSGPSNGGGTGAPHPTHDPGGTPSGQPSDGCTQLTNVLNCVLAPITSHP